MGDEALARLEGIHWKVDSPVPTRILHPIDLTLDHGESLAIVGPSGAGKSSLAAILGALQPPSGGSYRFEGTQVHALAPRESAAFRSRQLGFVFQNANLIDERSAWRNVALAFTDASLDRHEVESRARRALADVGLGRIADREAALLSGGERQRVAIARALVKQPRLVIADEPTGSLDRATGANVLDLLYALTAKGVTLVAITHDLTAAKRANRVVRIVDGRLLD